MRPFCAALAASIAFCCLVAYAETHLGMPLSLGSATPIPDILADPGPHVGKTVQVKGKVSAVCEMMGCWMNLTDPASGKFLRVKVKDGEIVFPKEAVGKLALAEGEFVKIELTREQAVAQARHEAEERGETFDPASVSGPVTLYQINGTGAVILD